jgi:hypothetical protein
VAKRTQAKEMENSPTYPPSTTRMPHAMPSLRTRCRPSGPQTMSIAPVIGCRAALHGDVGQRDGYRPPLDHGVHRGSTACRRGAFFSITPGMEATRLKIIILQTDHHAPPSHSWTPPMMLLAPHGTLSPSMGRWQRA